MPAALGTPDAHLRPAMPASYTTLSSEDFQTSVIDAAVEVSSVAIGASVVDVSDDSFAPFVPSSPPTRPTL